MRGAARAIEDDIEQEAINFVHANGKQWMEYAREIAEEFDKHRDAGEWNPLRRVSSELRYRALNWLLAFRAYLDHKHAQLSRRYGSTSGELARFDVATSDAYDSSFAYRFCYRLRNYAQHVGFPPLEVTIRQVDVRPGTVEKWAMLELDRDALLDQYDGWGAKVDAELRAGKTSLLMEEQFIDVEEQLDRIHRTVLEIDSPYLQEQIRILRSFTDQAPEGPGSPHLVRLRSRRGRLVGVDMHPLPPVEQEPSQTDG